MSENAHKITVRISKDYYEAYIDVEIDREAPSLTAEMVKFELGKKNVSFGIESHTLEKLIKEQVSVDDLLIAKGVRHKNGVDGEITYHFDTNLERKPEINEDGTVDFKNMNFLHTVEAGDVLATRTMPTEGANGTTVTGRSYPAKKGKVVNFKIGKNVSASEDGLQVIADCTGNLEFKNNKITVIDVLKINEDVGVSTGNLNFSGDIIINGNVTSGYSVYSEANVVINGIVESANVKADGDLIINGGIQGNDQAEIKVGGDFIAKFINNAKVDCQGKIESDAIMHSDIYCNNSVFAIGKRGQIIGGNLYARNLIKASTIGTEFGIKTKLELGRDDAMLDDYHQLESRVESLNGSLQKLKQAQKMLKQKYEQTGSEEDKLVLQKTEQSATGYALELEKVRAELRSLSEIMEETQDAHLLAATIYSGTVIKISGSYYNVKSRLDNARLVKDGGEVRLMAAE